LLIPIAPLTAATTGGLLCNFTHISARLQVPVIVYSWWLLGLGLLLSLMLDVLYLVRLMVKSVLPAQKAPTAVIVIGPLGQAATALILLGTAVSHGAFAEYDRGAFLTADTQSAIFAASVLGAMLLQVRIYPPTHPHAGR
jgi:tellurite resistance protein TehA-like permease